MKHWGRMGIAQICMSVPHKALLDSEWANVGERPTLAGYMRGCILHKSAAGLHGVSMSW